MDSDEKVIVQRIPNETRRIVISKTSNNGSGNTDNGEFTIKVRFPLKHIVNIKLIKATFTHIADTSIDNDSIILHIDNLDRIDSEKTVNNFENSFAILDFNKNLNNYSGGSKNIYTNTYEENNDIVYYCPPISLSSFIIKLCNSAGVIDYNNTLKLDLEVETLSDRRT
tara:strand:- start:18 stop:521 length:504 start_codon:yes stop_codon:yes gene_type:complete